MTSLKFLEPNKEAGWALIEEAAYLGDRNCIWKMAQKNQTQSPKNLQAALQWYRMVFNLNHDFQFSISVLRIQIRDSAIRALSDSKLKSGKIYGLDRISTEKSRDLGCFIFFRIFTRQTPIATKGLIFLGNGHENLNKSFIQRRSQYSLDQVSCDCSSYCSSVL